MSGMRWFWVTLLLAGFVASPVSADEDREALTRLKRYGGLSGGSAKRLLKSVERRMKKSADNFTPATDPLRMAVSRALFKADVPPNAMQGAKVRLRLFAGANAWALETFFQPRPGQIANCQQTFSLASDECAALVAAAGQVSLTKAQTLAAGGATTVARGTAGGASPFGGGPAARPTPARRAPASGRAGFSIQAPPPTKRFAKYDSGYRGNGGARRPMQSAPAPTMAAPQRPAPQRPAVNAGQQMSTKNAYKARREAYLARQRARMEAKKQAKAKAAEPAPEAAPAASAASEDPLEAAEAPAAAAKPKQQLSDDFLDGLMDDPLGK